MFEHHKEPLLPMALFWLRLLRGVLFAFIVLAAGLVIGMLGYRRFGPMGWCDSFVNAAMILSGMGPVAEMTTDAGKLFAGFYALFSGLAFAAILGLVFAPLLHRLMHAIHISHKEES